MTLAFAVLTVSDRASQGLRPDLSGPTLAEMIRSHGWEITRQLVLPDDMTKVRETLAQWADESLADIILTTGGTGFGPRDITPEATLAVIEREAPGLAEAMRAASQPQSPHAMLSRARAGIRGRVLIVNLPGSPKAAAQNLQTVLPALEHAGKLLRGDPSAEADHAKA